MSDKTASSQAAWALLVEGVSRSRVDAHRMKHMLTRALQLVEASPEKEHLYQVAGDIIVGMPKRLEDLEVALDRTSLALSKMGQDFLEARLPLSEKALVDEAVASAFGKPRPKDSDVERLAMRYLASVSFPDAPQVIQEVLASLTKDITPHKLASFWRWEFGGREYGREADYSDITYNPNHPNEIHLSGNDTSLAFRWFHFNRHWNEFTRQPLISGGREGPVSWVFELKNDR